MVAMCMVSVDSVTGCTGRSSTVGDWVRRSGKPGITTLFRVVAATAEMASFVVAVVVALPKYWLRVPRRK